MKPQENRSLELDMQGEDVLALQEKLQALEWYKGELTGIFDKSTEEAVSAFQNKYFPSKREKREASITLGVADQTTAEAINREYELRYTRRRLGIPELDSVTISRLKRAGIHSLGDVPYVDTELLRARSQLDEQLLTLLQQMAEISNATGLYPRNAYALVHLGGITGLQELEEKGKEEIKAVLRNALVEGMISEAEARQMELFVEHRETHPVGSASPVVQKILSMLEETEAAKLVESGIRKGSDLRSMDVKKVASLTEINESHLLKAKHVGELLQVRGMTPEVAIALVEKADLEGLEGLAGLTRSSFLDKLTSLLEAGLLDATTVKLMDNRSSMMIEAALTSVCQSRVCSDRKYLDYLIERLRRHYHTFDETVALLSGWYKQDFGRSGQSDSPVLLVEIVISVLEQVVTEDLSRYLISSGLGAGTARRTNETYRHWLIRLAAKLPDPGVFPSDSPWAVSQMSLPDTVVGSEYVSALIDLWVISQDRPLTAAERVRGGRDLSAEYNINILCGGCHETTWLQQAWLTLQETLCDRGISFKTFQEWCLEEKARHYPENQYQFKVAMFGYHQVLPWMPELDREWVHDGINTLLAEEADLGFGDNDQFVEQLLTASMLVLQADEKIVEGHGSLATFELLRALGLYTRAEANLMIALGFALGSAYSIGKTQKHLEDVDLGWLLRLVKNAIDTQWGGNQFQGTGSSVPLNTAPYTAMRDLYRQRRDFVPQDTSWESVNALTEILKLSDIPLHVYCAQHPGDQGWECQTCRLHLSVLVDRILGMILHLLFCVIPISMGDVLSQLGDYRRAYWYYNVIYSLDTVGTVAGSQVGQVYPYLNESIELPRIKIRHGTNLLAWADSLYRENTHESLVQAKYLYQRVLDLYDDCIPDKEDQFDEMSRAIYSLLNLDYDNLPAPSSSIALLIEAVANLRNQPVHVQEIPKLYQAVGDVTKGEDREKIAAELSGLLPLEIRFYESRNVFAVVGTSLPHRELPPLSPLDTVAASMPTVGELMPIGAPCKPPFNPAIQAQIHRARMRLVQMERCLNILGYSDDMVPILRFEYLIDQAKMFVGHAIAAEKDFIQFLSAAESGNFDELTAQQGVEISVANLKFEQARARIAQQRIKVAKLQRNQVIQELKDLEVEIRQASDPIFEQAEWANASDEYANQISFLGINFGALNQPWGGALGDFRGALDSWTSSGDWKGWVGDPVGTFIAQEWGRGEPPIETRRKAAAKARNNQISKLERQKALLQNYGVHVAQQQVDISIAEHELAQRQVGIAQLQVEHAQEILALLQTNFLNKELWYDLAKEIRAIYRNLLDYAIATAFLAEQALEYEMNQRLDVIRFDYYKPGKQGLLGAETLQQDIATLAYQKIVLTEEKQIPVKAVVSLAEEYPLEFLRFTQTGRTRFATDFGQFDLLVPGTYHSRISRVEVVIEGLVPPEGVHGTLSTSGISYIRTRENQTRSLTGNPETMILSSYTIRGDQVVFHKTGEELELFEGLGVVTDWVLEMPKAANNLNYQTIADVKLVIYHSAFFDDNLRKLVLRRLSKGGDAYRGFSMRFQFPDEFYHFQNDITKNGNQYQASLTFETSDAYFPINQEHRRIVNIDLVLVSASTALPAPLPFTLSSNPVDGGAPTVAAADLTRQAGYQHVGASSNVGVIGQDGTPEPPASQLNDFAGLAMDRTWELKFNLGPHDPNDASFHPEFFRLNDAGAYTPDLSQIDDILFFVEYQHDRTDLTVIEHFEDSAANWPDDAESRVGHWVVEAGAYRGSVNGSEARSRLDVTTALARFPTKVQDQFKRAVSDNTMVSFRTKLSDGNGHDNDARFFFANGNYLLTLGREGAKTQLSRLSATFDSTTATLLKETNGQDSLLKSNRWYTVQVCKFRGHIDVTIDGAEIINVYDQAPKEGIDIGVGTFGRGTIYFDDILI
jgi:hypothetical protein